MPKHILKLSLDLPAGQKPTSVDLYDLLEAALDQASRDPSALLASFTLEPGQDANANWVLRSEGCPREFDIHGTGSRSELLPHEIPESAFHGPDTGQDIKLNGDNYWCHRDFLEGDPVFADIHSDDDLVKGQVDIRSYLMQATAGDINELIREDWSHSEAADAIAYTLEGQGNPTAAKLFAYLALNPEFPTGDQLGFEVVVEGDDALKWLKIERPDIYRKLDIDREDEPGF